MANRFKESLDQLVDRVDHENAEVLDHLQAHAAEQGIPVDAIAVAGQLAFLCRSCGDFRTIDTIRAEANKKVEGS